MTRDVHHTPRSLRLALLGAALCLPALLYAQTSLPQSAPSSAPASLSTSQPTSQPTPATPAKPAPGEPKKPDIPPELLPFVPIVNAELSVKQTTLGGIVNYTLTIEHSPEVSVIVPEPLLFGSALRVRKSQSIVIEQTATVVKETRRYELQVFGLGDVEVPSFSFDFRAPPGIAKVVSPALQLKVPKTLPPEEDLNDKFTPREILPAEAAWLTWLKTYGPYLGGLLLLSVLAYVLYKKMQKLAPPEELLVSKADPFLVAVHRLDALEKERPPAKEFHLRLSEALREYIEDALLLPAREATSAELLTRLQQRALPSTEKIDRKKLEYFLAENDMVKFAKQVPPLPELLQSLEFVRGVVTETRPKPEEPT